MRAVLFGAGVMGRRHLKVLQDYVPSIDNVTVIDPCKAVRTTLVKNGECAPDRVFDTLHSALKADPAQFDLAVIGTTAPYHAPIIEELIEYEVPHILTEKPLCCSVADANRLITLAEQAGTRCAVNHQLRFVSPYARVKELFETGVYGALQSISLSAGNFGIAMGGSHSLELFRFMTGNFPARYQGWLHDCNVQNPRGSQYIDLAGEYRAEDTEGRTLYVNAKTTQCHGILITYAGELGQVSLDLLNGHLYAIARSVENRNWPSTRYGGESSVLKEHIADNGIFDATAKMLQALLDGCNYMSLSDGAEIVRGLSAIHLSNDSGHRVILSDDPYLSTLPPFAWA